MRWLVLSLILVSSLAGAQSPVGIITDCRLGKCEVTTEDFGFAFLVPPGTTFPDAPQPQPKTSLWKQKWDYNRPQRTYAETFKSPLFYGPFVGLLAANAIDIEATRASGCGEAHEFGKKPTRLEQYGQDYAADFAVGTMAFFLHRAHVKVIPQAMLGYGIAIHIRGAIHGFQANCR